MNLVVVYYPNYTGYSLGRLPNDVRTQYIKSSTDRELISKLLFLDNKRVKTILQGNMKWYNNFMNEEGEKPPETKNSWERQKIVIKDVPKTPDLTSAADLYLDIVGKSSTEPSPFDNRASGSLIWANHGETTGIIVKDNLKHFAGLYLAVIGQAQRVPEEDKTSVENAWKPKTKEGEDFLRIANAYDFQVRLGSGEKMDELRGKSGRKYADRSDIDAMEDGIRQALQKDQTPTLSK